MLMMCLGIRRPFLSYYDSSLLDGSAASKNILSERNRRRKLNERLFALRSVVPNIKGRRFDFFNHLKAAVDSLSAPAWIAFTGKDCGMSMPIAHVEESLRDYVKSFYPLGPVWTVTGKTTASSALKASPSPKTSAPGAPAPPPSPLASLFSSEPSQASSSKPKEGMAAVFQEINYGKPVTLILKKVTDDMKTKNRADRVDIVGSSEKLGPTASPSFSKTGPSKLKLQMGRKWVVENQIGRKNLVIDDCDAKQSVYIFGCKDSVLQIQGMVNNITVDKCTKLGVVFKDVVGAFEIVNSNGIEVQRPVNGSNLEIYYPFQ
ncbi:cyclase-associated protein 1-like [Cucumis melo var. makuwa]|uniref:Cyclase-associated protein 1-like n=1 Tax=Cucumis melo var. makuwa TaxID=1194695 RepID=A0A5A7SQ38_CUCMM|nr:cyclase-associated protein 1-like [Cucumis melo var. makuwa]TYK21592.1 cyclase-associated protein 1-like [Cucumis melo var. makuwa]